MSEILHTWGAYPGRDTMGATQAILERSRNRQHFYELAVKMLATAQHRGLRLIMENPWGCHSYLRSCFVTPPALIDRDRSIRGDFFAKPTAFWFINSEPTNGMTICRAHKPKRVKKDVDGHINEPGLCNEERSMISPDYARNFICDFIIGKEQIGSQLQLFNA